MKIKLHEIPVREVVAGYKDSAENGVVGYDGRLNIRPAFQRAIQPRHAARCSGSSREVSAAHHSRFRIRRQVQLPY